VSPDNVPQAKNEGGSGTVASPTVPIKQPGKSERGVGVHPSIFSLLPASSHARGSPQYNGDELEAVEHRAGNELHLHEGHLLVEARSQPGLEHRVLEHLHVAAGSEVQGQPAPRAELGGVGVPDGPHPAHVVLEVGDAVAAQHARAVRQHIIRHSVLRVPRHRRVQPLGRRRRSWASGAWLRLGVPSAASNSVQR
jgi:hypothetical protein